VSDWFCSKCGGGSVAVAAARPSLDDRYAVGYCIRCTADPKADPKDPMRTKPVNKPTVPLVRADVWDPGKLAADAERQRIRRLFNDKNKHDEADYRERERLLAEWDAEATDRRGRTP